MNLQLCSREMPSWLVKCPLVALATLVSPGQRLGETEAGKAQVEPRARRPPRQSAFPWAAPASHIGPPKRGAHPVLLTEGSSRQSPRAKQTPRSPNFPLP